MSKQLHLFTANFPFGNGESFLNNEIPYLEDAIKPLSKINEEYSKKIQKSDFKQSKQIEKYSQKHNLKLVINNFSNNWTTSISFEINNSLLPIYFNYNRENWDFTYWTTSFRSLNNQSLNNSLQTKLIEIVNSVFNLNNTQKKIDEVKEAAKITYPNS